MKESLPQPDQVRLIREWAAAYRAWNESELVRRRASAGQESLQEKLAAFFEQCETMFKIVPSKSERLYQAQLQAHLAERERIQQFEARRARGKPTTVPDPEQWEPDWRTRRKR